MGLQGWACRLPASVLGTIAEPQMHVIWFPDMVRIFK